MSVVEIYKSPSISGRFAKNHGFIAEPYTHRWVTFCTMYQVNHSFVGWVKGFFQKRASTIVRVSELNNRGEFVQKSNSILAFISERAKYPVAAYVWVTCDHNEKTIEEWIDLQFTSKRDAMLFKLGWMP